MKKSPLFNICIFPDQYKQLKIYYDLENVGLVVKNNDWYLSFSLSKLGKKVLNTNKYE